MAYDMKRVAVACIASLLAIGAGWRNASAQCSGGQMTAVFVVSGLRPGTDRHLDRLAVFQVGENPSPSDSQNIAAVNRIQPRWYYRRIEQVGTFIQYFDEPVDFGGVGIVDSRDGTVVFAGTVIWMGRGVVNYPAESSHSWSFDPSNEASAPASLGIMSNCYWYFETPEEITAATLSFLRHTDVLQSFSSCAAYSAVSYVYTPSVGMTDPEVAKCIVIVSGHCGAPWSGEPTSVEHQTWGAVKGMFR
jgi:hypothetical protein